MSTTATPRQQESGPALPVTLADVRDLPTLPVYSATEPSLAGILRVSRWTAYRTTRQGAVPSLRVAGRVVVPVPMLRRLLGDLPPDAPAPTP